MKPKTSRRDHLKIVGASAAAMVSDTVTPATAIAQVNPDLAIDRSGAAWGNRPMYLRAYHPTYVVYYYAALRDGAVKSRASIVKWKPLTDRVENEPGLTVRIIEAYDDACAGCANLKPDPMGSAWGVGYSCTTIKKPESLKAVTLACRRILGDMGLYYGSEIKMRDLVAGLTENVPVLYEHIGGENNQVLYEKGLNYLKEKYGLS
ncbi:hypothetical protein ACFL47_06785 [Candidatus Latescibacterota bacterium]